MGFTVQLILPVIGGRCRLPFSSISKASPADYRFPPLHSQIRTVSISAARIHRIPFPVVKATGEESRESAVSKSESGKGSAREGGESEATLSEIGAEIKKAMMEKKEREGGLSFGGVAEEVREIEWPAFRKVLGTTGVVLGIIAGSSVVLLTVNFVLAELSDRVFAGKGVQDFFS